MRFFVFIALSLLLLSCGDNSSEISQQLKSKHWFVRGEFWERDHKATLTTDSSSKHEWNAVFYENGKMKYSSFITQSYTDTNDVVHPAGEIFTDTSYTYELKKNILKVTKGNDSYYLKLKPKGNDTFEILSVGASEFR